MHEMSCLVRLVRLVKDTDHETSSPDPLTLRMSQALLERRPPQRAARNRSRERRERRDLRQNQHKAKTDKQTSELIIISYRYQHQ